MDWRRLVPASARAEPEEHFAFRFVALAPALPAEPERIVAEALAGVRGGRLERLADAWILHLPWVTRVFGVIPREVDERVVVRLGLDQDGPRVAVTCTPSATHEAHAAGLAGVLAAAGGFWFAAGLPAALTALAGGWLLVTFTRELALQGLERRIRRLAEDLGTALWPGVPAQVLPHPRRLV